MQRCPHSAILITHSKAYSHTATDSPTAANTYLRLGGLWDHLESHHQQEVSVGRFGEREEKEFRKEGQTSELRTHT